MIETPVKGKNNKGYFDLGLALKLYVIHLRK
jgi:hypothetical protein